MKEEEYQELMQTLDETNANVWLEECVTAQKYWLTMED